MATERHAQVTWHGDLMHGDGTVDEVGSGAFGALAISWPARAEEKQQAQTSPEEMIAAAHASCFSMAISHALAQAGTPAEHLSASATVTFVPGTGITKSALEVTGRVPGIDDQRFQDAAEEAKENCPVSKALRGNVELTLNARLEQA